MPLQLCVANDLKARREADDRPRSSGVVPTSVGSDSSPCDSSVQTRRQEEPEEGET